MLSAAGRDRKVARNLNGEPAAWAPKAKAAERQYRLSAQGAWDRRNATSYGYGRLAKSMSVSNAVKKRLHLP